MPHPEILPVRDRDRLIGVGGWMVGRVSRWTGLALLKNYVWTFKC